MQDLMPLFLFKKAGKDEMKQAGAIITAGGESYKASSFISNIGEAIQDEVKELVKGGEIGELTVAAYILLEALHRAGLVKTADTLLGDPNQLFQTAVCTAIGIRAGMIIPEDTKFETTTNDIDISLRNLSKNEDSDPE
jgi:hypothetical protein